MALQADPSDSSEKSVAGGASAIAGLPRYWDVANCHPKTEWGNIVRLICHGRKREIFNFRPGGNENSNKKNTQSS